MGQRAQVRTGPLLLPMAWGDWDDLRNLLESCDLLPEWVPGVRPMDTEAG